MTAATLAMPATPARSRLVAAVEAATLRGRDRYANLRPATIYLSPADANAAGLQWQHFAKSDPPRVLGLPIRVILGKGKSRLYLHGGHAVSLHTDLNPKPPKVPA